MAAINVVGVGWAEERPWVAIVLDRPLYVEVLLGDRAGVPVMLGLRLQRSDEPITQTMLRRLPLAELTRIASSFTRGDMPEARRVAARMRDERTPGKAWDDEHYREVAAVYRSALGGAPSKAIQERWSVGRAMASRYIKEARRRGYLGPPAKPGVAGSVDDREEP